MEPWLMWVVAGFALIIAELITGTFYLLVIGIGAFAGALASWLGVNFIWQAVAGSAVALAGAFGVHHWHAATRKGDAGHANLLDLGQPVVLEGWTNESAGIARVKYRGTSWDARVPAAAKPAPGTTLYIEGQEGSMLIVAATPAQTK